MSAGAGEARAPPPLASHVPNDPHADAFSPVRLGVLLPRLLAEVLGTFALVFVDCGGAVVGFLAPTEVTPEARSLATGLLVMALVYTVGDVSGAHFNPSVTFAFALRRAFPWSRVPSYWLAQSFGALGAATLLRALFGAVAQVGATHPHFGSGRALVFEITLTFLLVCVVLGTASRHRVLGANAALASGGVVALCSLFSRPISGPSMNPARSLAPGLVSGDTDDFWIYLVGPFLGALLAVVAMRGVHPHKHSGEKEAAVGETKR